VLQTKPSLCWCTEQLAASFQLSSTNRRHPLARRSECQRLGPLEFSKFVTLLRLWRWLMLWSLLHVGHSLLHGLQHLSLHDQYLLQCWWWRRVGIVVVIVLMSGTVVSVGYLMIVKRFEIEIKKSQLYASRYNDD
jgi:hypothetical protein